MSSHQHTSADPQHEPYDGVVARQPRPDPLQASPRQLAQRARIDASFGPAAQLQPEPGPEPNRTGLPDGLKSGIESLSGMDMSAVRVHRNSDQPAELNALAYAQGNDIHLAPGQEQHLPHEAWHVVQQAQGRVRPTMQLRGSVDVNDDEGLEREADAMGSRAAAGEVAQRAVERQAPTLPECAGGVAQRMPEARARAVNVTFNSLYHVGHNPVLTAAAAVALTQARRATGWNAAYNHVVYDFNRANLAELLFQRLLRDEFHTLRNGHYVVQLPEVNYFVVDRYNQCQLDGGQCAMMVDSHNMNAYHMVFP